MSTSQIIVNSFTFCERHGDEYCQSCGVDHRLANNAQVADDLSNLEDVFEIGLEERQPINVYARGATAIPDTQGSFECILHGAVNCSMCFNWVAIIEKEAHEAAELGSWLERRNSR
ncbi:hypothetical protein F5887DRAFT_927752 [Amanita rubescens]|nr:hypothetical protein F5887DRAFT_927752 [Amanita rubescens]